MGYESRVYVVIPFQGSYDEKGRRNCEIVATFNLCVVSDGFVNLFKETSDFNLRDDIAPIDIDIDKYGAPLKMAKVADVMEAIEQDKEAMNYRRTRSFYEFLKDCINRYDEEMYLIHYGY